MHEFKTFYQFYSLSYTSAELLLWVPFLKQQNYSAVYFTPIFSSSNHGYDTIDYAQVDPRFGSNSQFRALVDALHDAGIAVVIDGVFNHVGRDFWAFRDVLEKRNQSQYLGWFKGLELAPDLENGSAQYFPEDGLNYSGWEGNFDLVTLNHDDESLQEHLFEAVQRWVDELGIDGVRLDVAYLLPDAFLQKLRARFPGLYLLGEQIHGDYKRLLDAGLDSVTDYNLYKAIWSSMRDKNFFELNWTLQEHQKDYPGRQLWTFLDNQDTDRIASRFLEQGDGGESVDEQLLRMAYFLLYTLPGTPSVYYGAEEAFRNPQVQTKRIEGAPNADDAIRQHVEIPQALKGSTMEDAALAGHVSHLAWLKLTDADLAGTDYEMLELTNTFIKYRRGEKVFWANLDDKTFGSSIPLRE
jgi:glycosidase